MARKPPADVSIGKFDILATYAYAKALEDGLSEAESKERGMVVAIMGARARLGLPRDSAEHRSQKEAAEKKRKSTITAASFDKRVSDRMGAFFDDVFFPTVRRLVREGHSYDDMKRLLKIPSTWGCQDQRRGIPASHGPEGSQASPGLGAIRPTQAESSPPRTGLNGRPPGRP